MPLIVKAQDREEFEALRGEEVHQLSLLVNQWELWLLQLVTLRDACLEGEQFAGQPGLHVHGQLVGEQAKHHHLWSEVPAMPP